MIIKIPPAYDTSYWEIVPDFAKVNPRPLVVSTKATEGSSIRDPKFLAYWTDLKQDGILRMAYHFHRKDIPETSQAINFIDTMQMGGVTSADILELDIEEGGESAAQIIAWLDLVEAAFPANRIMIYGRKNILDPIPMTATQATRLRKYKIWTAGYPNNPDLYDTVPAAYIPNPAKWGEVWMWQYTDHANVTGIIGNVDADWLAPEFQIVLGHIPQPPIPEPTHPFSGVEYYKFPKNGVNVFVLLIDLTGKRVKVLDTQGELIRVSDAAIAHNAQIAVNFDEWDIHSTGPYLPRSLAASDGDIYQASQLDFRPFLNVEADNHMQITHHLTPLYNTGSFLRYLIVDGIRQAWLSDPDKIENKELHARSAKGITKDNRLMIVGCEGKTLTAGLTLPMLADVFEQFNAQQAAENDAGGSFALWIKDQIVNAPSDPEERAVVQPFMIFIPEGSTTMKQYKVIWTNGVTKRTQPTTSSTGGTVIQYNTIIDVVEDKIPDQTYPTDPNKLWVKFTDGTYGASIYGAGSERMIDVTPPTQPPATGDIHLDATLKSDGTITGTWANV